MHDIERELIEATGYKARQKYANRQDYLKSILNAVAKLTDDDFDALTDETAFWVNAAVEAHNSKNEEIVDFDDLDPTTGEDDPEGPDDNEENIDPETGEVHEDDEPETEDEEVEAETEEVEAEIEEPSPVKILKEKPKSRKKSKKFAKQVPSPERKKPQKSAPNRVHPLHNDEDVILDKWGCMEGSKNSKALALFEQGATATEIKLKLGGTYYNILARCVANGHKMEKEGHIIKLTHKNELGKRATSKATPVKKKVK